MQWYQILTAYTVGNLIGAIAGGYLTDLYAERQARRNGGVFVRLSDVFFFSFGSVQALLGYGVLERRVS